LEFFFTPGRSGTVSITVVTTASAISSHVLHGLHDQYHSHGVSEEVEGF